MIFKASIKHHLEVMKNESDMFYLGVIHRPRLNVRFKTSKLGERSFSNEKHGCKNVANHSVRRTCITTFRQENIDNLSIAGLFAHRNLLSLDDYSTISEEQQAKGNGLHN